MHYSNIRVLSDVIIIIINIIIIIIIITTTIINLRSEHYDNPYTIERHLCILPHINNLFVHYPGSKI